MLALVLVDPLHLNVEHPVRIQPDAGLGQDVVGQPGLVNALDRPPFLLERRIAGQWFQRAQPLHVGHPTRTDGLIQKGTQSGVRQPDEPARRHAIGLIAEALRPHLIEVFEDRGLHQFGVQGRDPVDGMATDGGQVCHPNTLGAVLADDRHPPNPVLIAGELRADFVEEPSVDFVDDLQVPRQELLEHLQRPGLQRLRQQRVVGIGQRRDCGRPGFVPAEFALVDQ